MMTWLYRNKETYIDGFDFKKLKRVDSGIDANRRSSFTDDEIKDLSNAIDKYIAEAYENIEEDGNFIKAVTAYYLMISLMTGLRRGEQLQLRWQDINVFEHYIKEEGYSLIKVTVRGETSKVRKTRNFVVKDHSYFDSLFNLLYKRFKKQEIGSEKAKKFANSLIFSVNG